MYNISKIFSIIFILLFTNSVYSQIDTNTVYLDNNGKKVSREKAKYISKRFKENGKWMAHDYYNSGELQMIGSYKSKEYKTKDGDFTYFYKNGQIKAKGTYENNYKIGNWTSWEETGEISNKGRYEYGKLDGTVFWYNKGSICSKEYYQDGEMKTYTFYDENGNKLPEDTRYEEPPEFPGGLKNLLLYIKKSMNYPEEAKRHRIQGKVFVSFTITKQGEIKDVEVVNKIDKSLKEEGIRIVENMPKWKPGMQHNKLVDVKFTLPILFRLPD